MPQFSSLLEDAKEILRNERVGKGFLREGALLVLEPSPIIVIGDIHGDLLSLKSLLKKADVREKIRSGWKAVFLGDYADRGPDPLEVYNVLFDLKLSFPENVFLLRGNHEGMDVVPFYPHDLPWHLRTLHPDRWEEIYQSLLEIHKLMPAAAIIDSWLILLHGGLSPQITRRSLSSPTRDEMEAILWSDPVEETDGTAPSTRGAGMRFGQAVSREVLEGLSVKHLIRSHSPVQRGYRFNHGGRVLTVFSAKYVYGLEKGAYLTLSPFEPLESGINLF
jgi:hypothetical protein